MSSRLMRGRALPSHLLSPACQHSVKGVQAGAHRRSGRPRGLPPQKHHKAQRPHSSSCRLPSLAASQRRQQLVERGCVLHHQPAALAAAGEEAEGTGAGSRDAARGKPSWRGGQARRGAEGGQSRQGNAQFACVASPLLPKGRPTHPPTRTPTCAAGCTGAPAGCCWCRAPAVVQQAAEQAFSYGGGRQRRAGHRTGQDQRCRAVQSSRAEQGRKGAGTHRVSGSARHHRLVRHQPPAAIFAEQGNLVALAAGWEVKRCGIRPWGEG